MDFKSIILLIVCVDEQYLKKLRDNLLDYLILFIILWFTRSRGGAVW